MRERREVSRVIGEAAIVEPGPPTTATADRNGSSGPEGRRSRPCKEQMAQALTRAAPTQAVQRGWCTCRVASEGSDGRARRVLPEHSGASLRVAAPGGRDGARPRLAPGRVPCAGRLRPACRTSTSCGPTFGRSTSGSGVRSRGMPRSTIGLLGSSRSCGIRWRRSMAVIRGWRRSSRGCWGRSRVRPRCGLRSSSGSTMSGRSLRTGFSVSRRWAMSRMPIASPAPCRAFAGDCRTCGSWASATCT